MEDSLKQFDKKNQRQVEVSVSSSKFIGKVFLYTFIALAITAVTAGVIGFIFSKAFTPIDYNTYVLSDTELIKPYLALLIVAVVMYIPLIIWIQIVCFRRRGGMVVPFVLYSIVMGILISSATMLVPFAVTAISFGITSLVFGGLALIGLTSKRDLSFLGMLGIGIIFGAMLIALFNLIWSLFLPGFQMLYWVVSYGIFVAVMLITIFDVWRVKKIAQSGENSNNIALYCAFNLYVDFIYIFLRVLTIVARVYGRNR